MGLPRWQGKRCDLEQKVLRFVIRANQIRKIIIDFKVDVTKINVKQLDPKYIVPRFMISISKPHYTTHQHSGVR